ncbi:MAG: flagellar hook-length control protein FliK [Candidatus Nitrotoga sp. LAW]|nr:MAG: flagellar hook-length control protein FliK [Candidatus Nitrotoga sp. LAW]
MQNTITPVAAPAAPAYTPTEVDGTAQAELFGNVLARQLANSVQLGEPNIPDTGLSITSAADNLLTITPSNEQSTEPQTPIPDGTNALSSDMLAALLPHNIAPQISIRGTQSIQPEAVTDDNRAQSISTRKMSLGYDAADIAKATLKYGTPDTTLEIINSFDGNKSVTPLIESQLSTQSLTQVNAPQPNTIALATLQTQTSSADNLNVQTQFTVNTPLVDGAWADEFSQKITWMATQNGQSAELHLNPPQLGPLDVLIKVDGDQATALFSSPHAVVRDAIEQALPKLREMLADNGIMLGNASVSDQSAREQQAKQTDQQHKKEGWQAKVDQSVFVGSTQAKSGHHHQGLVDTFA